MRLFDAGEADVEAAEGVGEALVVDAEDVEHRGVQVAEVDRVFGDVVAEVSSGLPVLELADALMTCYNTAMQDRVTIGRRGAITIPARLRDLYGLKPNDELIIEPSDGGLLLRPVTGESIELYTEDRIAEFASDEEALRGVS